MSDWQTIETAPKDGTEIMLYGIWAGEINGMRLEPGIEVGLWDGGRSDYGDEGWWACVGGDAFATWCKATHWMPLPEPPKDES